MKMNRLLLLTAGSASLILGAGVALGAAPSGAFGQYTVTAGVPSGCPAGTTCTALVGATQGFLQQTVTVTSGANSGQSYIQTIIVPNGATTTSPSSLSFSDESYVGSASNSGAFSDQQNVNFLTLGTAGVGNAQVNLAKGGLAVTGTLGDVESGAADCLTGTPASCGGGSSDVRITQVNDMTVDGTTNTDTAGNVLTATDPGGEGIYVNFSFIGLTDNSSMMQVDEAQLGSPENDIMTARDASGDFVASSGVLTLPSGATVSYNAGDDIHVSFTSQDLQDGSTFGEPIAGAPGATLAAFGNAGAIEVEQVAVTPGGSGGVDFANPNTVTASWDNAEGDAANANSTPVAGEPAYDNSGEGGLTNLIAFVPMNSPYNGGVTVAGALSTVPIQNIPGAYGGGNMIQWPSQYWNPAFGTAPEGLAMNTSGTAIVAPPAAAYTSMTTIFGSFP